MCDAIKSKSSRKIVHPGAKIMINRLIKIVLIFVKKVLGGRLLPNQSSKYKNYKCYKNSCKLCKNSEDIDSEKADEN
jgi:hypothetical protein